MFSRRYSLLNPLLCREKEESPAELGKGAPEFRERPASCASRLGNARRPLPESCARASFRGAGKHQQQLHRVLPCARRGSGEGRRRRSLAWRPRRRRRVVCAWRATTSRLPAGRWGAAPSGRWPRGPHRRPLSGPRPTRATRITESAAASPSASGPATPNRCARPPFAHRRRFLYVPPPWLAGRCRTRFPSAVVV